ncbi:YebG family protein [Teredinibacter purpureus]|uniref:YebG family protein n=1 Tax=Teredinibacter purpureus TaxID=2731756 RepID=UPI0005F853CE|nr:YebG family protein [Teredinibacter purpureus]
MAVIAVWKCDRDGSMFDDKKAADAHDKMLELAESITRLIEANIPTVSDEDVEAIGLLLAKRSDDLVKACKGKPSVLLEAAPMASDDSASTESVEDSNVTSLTR